MRVLLLRRQALGGIATHTDDLAGALQKFGVEATVQDATSWIPNETSIETGRKVTKELKPLGDGFDLVHAFGYRTAWACAEAYGAREAWVYTAYDPPKTTHTLLMDKLLDAQMGIASCRYLRTLISDNGGGDLDVVYPGVRRAEETDLNLDSIREALSLPADAPVILGMGRFVPERGFDSLIESMETVWEEHPEANLVLVGEGPQEKELRDKRWTLSKPDQVKMPGPTKRPRDMIAIASLVAVPSRTAGFSMVAGEAMSSGKPVILREIGGLREMIEREVSGRFFDTDPELPQRIRESLSMPLSLEVIGNAARIRADDMFSLDYCAERTAQIYRDVLS